MSLAGDSITVTPGTGATVATETVSAKEHQVVMLADSSGHILKTKPTFVAVIPNQVHVASASNPAWDLFNATGSGVKIRITSIRQIPDIVTAVTGVAISWLLERTSAVGTGGTSITPYLPDTGGTALSGSVTCRSKPTGGATAGTDLFPYALSSEETNAGTIAVASQGGLELIPAALLPVNEGPGIVLNPNEGIRVTQVTSSSVGNSAWVITFTQE